MYENITDFIRSLVNNIELFIYKGGNQDGRKN